MYYFDSSGGCDFCEVFSGFYIDEPVRPHPNCNCSIREVDLLDFGGDDDLDDLDPLGPNDDDDPFDLFGLDDLPVSPTPPPSQNPPPTFAIEHEFIVVAPVTDKATFNVEVDYCGTTGKNTKWIERFLGIVSDISFTARMLAEGNGWTEPATGHKQNGFEFGPNTKATIVIERRFHTMDISFDTVMYQVYPDGTQKEVLRETTSEHFYKVFATVPVDVIFRSCP